MCPFGCFVLVHLVPTVDAAQVLPDWRGPRTNGDGTLHDEALDALRVRTAKACNPSLVTAEEKKRKTVPTLKQEYQANKHAILALENSMKSTLPDGALKHCVVEDAPRALLPGEERYRVPINRVGDYVRRLSPDRVFRACVSRADGSGEYECDWGHQRRMLVLDSDRGSSGWPGFNYLFSDKVDCRGHAVPDIFHRRNDGVHTAFQKSKCGAVEAEGVILFNFFKGAFGLNSNFFILKGSFMQWWKSSCMWDAMFRFCYPWIVAFKEKGVFPAAYGSEEHMLEVFKSLPLSPLWSSTGTALKLSRWMAWNVKERGNQVYFGEFMLAFLVLGLFEGFYQSLTDLPFAASELEDLILKGDGHCVPREEIAVEIPPMDVDDDGGEGGDGDAVPAARVPVRAGDKDGSEVFCQRKKRNAQLCMQITTRPLTLRCMVAMRGLAEPIEFEHHDNMATVKDPVLIKPWVIDLAKKGYNKYLFEVIKRFSDGDFLTECLFANTFEKDDEDESSGDADLAKAFFEIGRNLISVELSHMRYHSCRPPMNFVSLIDADPAVRTEAVEWCAQAQKCLYIVEALARHDVFFKAYLRDMMWPSNAHVREVLVGIEETDHTKLPSDLEPEIESLAVGLNSSLCCEETFKLLNAAAKHSSSGSLSRKARWHRQLVASLPTDYHRTMPVITSEVEHVRQKSLDDSVFDYTQVDQDKYFSLGHETLEAISSKDFQF